MKSSLKQCVVDIVKYSKKGIAQGVSEAFQKGVEVRGAHLNEQLLVEVFKKSKGVHQGRILEVLKPHPSRVVARCSHAKECGGCSWQTLNYEDQVQYKENGIRKLFAEFLEEVELKPIISMDDPWGCRNKMEFSFSQDKERTKFLGLVIGGSKGRVLNLQECHVTSSWMIDVLKAVREWWDTVPTEAYHPFSQNGTLETLMMREGKNTQDKLVVLTVCGDVSSSFSHKELASFKKAVLEAVSGDISLFLQIKQIKKGQTTQVHEMHLHGKDHLLEKLFITKEDGSTKEYQFKVSPASFFQPNTFQAQRLFSKAIEMVSKKDGGLNIIDLYCGIGTIGIVFSSIAKKVIGVELNPYAVCDAEVNVELNHVDNMKVFKGDVHAVLKELPVQQDVDLVILDPPRAGLGPKAIEDVIRLDSKEIIYISCNPLTQIEDIKIFLSRGYKLIALQPVDQFPHTPHLENIALLRK